MSRFRKLTQTIWHCQYHIVWVPKYRYRVLSGQIAEEVNKCIRGFSEQKKCEIIELNVQIDQYMRAAIIHVCYGYLNKTRVLLASYT